MAAWPTGTDLADWLRLGGNAASSAARTSLHNDIVEAVIDAMWGDLDAEKMPDQAGPADTRCPPGVRLAVLILSARVDSRRQSTNGVIASGELFLRVSRDDPDYTKLIARYAVSALP